MLFRQMKYFQAIVETGNFSEAAENCHISQSAISQQIKKLEDEIGIDLIERHNRRFTVTPAGMHFYKKSLIICSDVEQTIRETKRISGKDAATLRLGFYKGYHGNELKEAVARISEKYPTLDITVMDGSHEEMYHALRKEEVDLVLNDQRRAFSDEYNNLILSEGVCHIEIASHNPLSRLDMIDTRDLKNIPCILVANESGQKEERAYYDEIIGLHGDFIYADTLQEARLKIVTGQGYLPVDVFGNESWFDTSVSRIPLTRKGQPIRRTYCAFWKIDNSGYYVEEFAEILKELFSL